MSGRADCVSRLLKLQDGQKKKGKRKYELFSRRKNVLEFSGVCCSGPSLLCDRWGCHTLSPTEWGVYPKLIGVMGSIRWILY